MECGSDYLEDVAGALGVDAAQILNWGKVGKQITAHVRQGTASEDDADHRLQVHCNWARDVCPALCGLSARFECLSIL